MNRILTIAALSAFTLGAQTTPPTAVAPLSDAQDRPVMRTIPDPSAPPRVGVSLTQRSLSVQEAIELALANNLDIEIERTNVDNAAQSVTAARGLFDPAFRWTPLFTSDNIPVASVLQGSGGKLTNEGLVNNFSLRQKLERWGTVGRIDFNNSRQTTNNPFSSFNPTLSSGLLVAITQPLVRGFRIDRDRTEIRVRIKQVDLARVDLETRIIEIVSRTEQGYYDLVAAREGVGVAQEQVGLGREQLAINQRLVDSGTLAPVEISAAEAELQRRVDTWYSSLAAVTETENNLKSLIAPERQASIWNDEILPSDSGLLKAQIEDLHEAVKIALKNRPELRAVTVRSGINDVQKELNANLRKPQVDLVAQYGLNGLAGTLSTIPNPLANANTPLYDRLNQLSVAQGLQPISTGGFEGTPSALVGSYGTALSNLFGANYQSFQVGVSLDFNIRNRTADATYGQTLINEKRLKLERIRAEQIIEAQIRNALQGIETGRQRIAAAEASARAAKEKLDSERRLYQTGESTNFLVLTRQNEYADSRRRSVVARLDFNKSVSRFEQALGTTLATHRVNIR
ncbi:MAG: TolC family protein [Bryobacteraceae bacterium]|nr:TolC family protein [Bryobacteraceae bacterium]